MIRLGKEEPAYQQLLGLFENSLNVQGMGTFADIQNQVADLVEKRSEMGKNYGIILIPEGLIEFIPEIGQLINELNSLVGNAAGLGPKDVGKSLSEASRSCFEGLPDLIQNQLLLDRDPHGNVQVSMIETEKLLISATRQELARRGFKGKFSAQSHFFGYEGRQVFLRTLIPTIAMPLAMDPLYSLMRG